MNRFCVVALVSALGCVAQGPIPVPVRKAPVTVSFNVSGVVKSVKGDPIAGVRVRTLTPDSPIVVSAADGTYSLSWSQRTDTALLVCADSVPAGYVENCSSEPVLVVQQPIKPSGSLPATYRANLILLAEARVHVRLEDKQGNLNTFSPSELRVMIVSDNGLVRMLSLESRASDVVQLGVTVARNRTYRLINSSSERIVIRNSTDGNVWLKSIPITVTVTNEEPVVSLTRNVSLVGK